MAASKKHSWHFEVFDPKSRWLFITPSEFAESLGLYILELGHFFQDGYCYTDRLPENSFALHFTNTPCESLDVSLEMSFPNHHYVVSSETFGQGVAVVDNRPGFRSEQKGPAESYFINFGGFLAEKYCRMLLNNETYEEYRINWIPSLLDTFEKLVLLYRQPSNEKRDVYATMLLTQVLSRLLMGSDPSQPLYVENHYVKQTLEILEDRFAETLKLKDIADELHINSSYLSRLITSETGTSFSSCLTHVRINHAKELLQTSEHSIEDIGEKCGFCNASHFVKLFHANESMTPLQYRILHRKDLFPNKNIT